MALHQKLDASVPVGQGATYTYRADGTLWTRTWARGVVATYTHNALGEMTGITYSGEPAGQQTPAVSIVRDARGRVVSVGAGAEARTYGWRADGRLEREDAGDGHALLYGYDAAGQRTGYALWDGGAANYATWGGWGYSGATGKLSGVSTPEGWISQGYDPATGAPLAWFTGTVTTPGYSQTSLRDGLGRVVTVTGSANGIAGHDGNVVRTYEYNPKGQRKSLLEESGEKWKYDYNARGEVKEGEKKVGSLSLWGMKRGYQYDAIGNRTELRVNDADKNWTANALNQIESRNVEGKQAVIGRADAAALVSATALADAPPNAPEVTMLARGGGTRFGAEIDTKNSGVAKYMKVTVTEQVSGLTPHDRTGHLFVPASPEQFGYDADGSLKQDGRWEYTYDAENRLIATKTREGMLIAGDPLPIERIEYRYDAFGRRTEMKVSVKTDAVWKVTKITRFAYDGWNLIAEWEATTVANQLTPIRLARTHHWGLDLSGTLQGAGGVGGLVLTRHLGPGATSYSAFPAYDGNGNIVALFETASGRRVAEYEYGPFGEALRATGPMAEGNPFRWSTKYTDNETGLVYYGYRYYSPGMGRWLSTDPIEERGGINLYGFVLNNPVGFVDLHGLWTTDGHDAILDDWLKDKYDEVPCGCCKLDVKQLLKNASARSDGFVGAKGCHWIPNFNPFCSNSIWDQQAAHNSHEHAMCSPEWSKKEAKQKYEKFVGDEIEKAKRAAKDAAAKSGKAQCDGMKDAIAALGSAFHAISDHHSPMHCGFQQWDGLGHGVWHWFDETRDHRRGEEAEDWEDLSTRDKGNVLRDLNRQLGGSLKDIIGGCKK